MSGIAENRRDDDTSKRTVLTLVPSKEIELASVDPIELCETSIVLRPNENVGRRQRNKGSFYPIG